MNSVLKDIRATLSQLFGFDKVEECKEWNDYLGGLVEMGYFSSQQAEDFKESGNYLEKLERGLEEPESSTKKKAKSFQIDNFDAQNNVTEKQISIYSEEKERE